MLPKASQRVLDRLFDIGAIQIDTTKGFKLAKHEENPNLPRSPYFYNFRKKDDSKSGPKANQKSGPLENADIEMLAAEILLAVTRAKIDFDAIAGVPHAGVPFAKAIIKILAQQGRKIPYVPIEKRERVTTRYIALHKWDRWNGAVSAAPRVLIIDDLITSKTMKSRVIHVLKEANYRIAGVGIYMDREEGGAKALAQEGVRCAAAMTTTKALKYYVDSGRITASDAEIIDKYRRTT